MLIERFKVAFTANVRFKSRNSQNRKWADKNSSKQFLWIKQAGICWFPCSYNEQQAESTGRSRSRSTNSRLPFAVLMPTTSHLPSFRDCFPSFVPFCASSHHTCMHYGSYKCWMKSDKKRDMLTANFFRVLSSLRNTSYRIQSIKCRTSN